MAGYSGTPLAKKLGITAGTRMYVSGDPGGYHDLLGALSPEVTIAPAIDRSTTLIHHFTTSRSELASALEGYRAVIAPATAIWISWPKRSSRVPTDVTEDVVRELALPLGFVDVKVCAIDDTWSGLRLVIRRELR